MARVRPDEAEIIGWMSSLSNWGRWGADDQLGTLNLITPEHRRRAAELVREGVAVSCAWDIRRGPQPGVTMETQRLMIATGQGATAGSSWHSTRPRLAAPMDPNSESSSVSGQLALT